MKTRLGTQIRSRSPLARAWLAVGGLLAAGAAWMIIRELPALRREWHIMSM